jgi:hypothetical protein
MANFLCAVALDDHNIKIAPIIKIIFAMETPPTETMLRLSGTALLIDLLMLSSRRP